VDSPCTGICLKGKCCLGPEGESISEISFLFLPDIFETLEGRRNCIFNLFCPEVETPN
jgi:hypothetical protein